MTNEELTELVKGFWDKQVEAGHEKDVAKIFTEYDLKQFGIIGDDLRDAMKILERIS